MNDVTTGKVTTKGAEETERHGHVEWCLYFRFFLSYAKAFKSETPDLSGQHERLRCVCSLVLRRVE